jgi:hypothetical protein
MATAAGFLVSFVLSGWVLRAPGYPNGRTTKARAYQASVARTMKVPAMRR